MTAITDRVDFWLNDDVKVVGIVTHVDPDEQIATVVEVMATHTYWGDSDGGRGTKHLVSTDNLRDVTFDSYQRAGIKRALKKAKAWKEIKQAVVDRKPPVIKNGKG